MDQIAKALRETTAKPYPQLLHWSKGAHRELNKQCKLTWPFLCPWLALSIFHIYIYIYDI